MTSKVVHVMRDKYDVDVSRSGPFGNPYSHKLGTRALYMVASREEAVQKYREYILNNKKLMQLLPKLKDKVLGCWCAGPNGLTLNDPIICHGQVLLQLLEELDEKSNEELISDIVQ